MKYLWLLFCILILSGCRTFTNTELKSYTEDFILIGYSAGYDDGFKTGKVVGYLDKTLEIIKDKEK